MSANPQPHKKLVGPLERASKMSVGLKQASKRSETRRREPKHPKPKKAPKKMLRMLDSRRRRRLRSKE